ncbi:MAG: hypothetical protein K6C06_08755 [Lachnospiraceae bacterium]|nr:hypothetical protein [Lachnospiraceae bacterium]
MSGIRKWQGILLLCMTSALILTGCTKNGKKPEEELQTQPETEEMTEPLTEEIDYRSILEVLDPETLAWMDSFDEDRMLKLVYTIQGEAAEEYTITDKKKIRSFLDALRELEVAGPAQLYASDAGDTFDFYSDEESYQRFSFIMGSVMIDGVCYETDNADNLWDLTGELLDSP